MREIEACRNCDLVEKKKFFSLTVGIGVGDHLKRGNGCAKIVS